MTNSVSISIDVPDMQQALAFYSGPLGCEFKTKYADGWQVLTIGGVDIHLQEKAPGTVAAAAQQRDYQRHWTPVHLDFVVPDIRPVCEALAAAGGLVEGQSFSEQADIAHCADPFGNGFCLIRE